MPYADRETRLAYLKRYREANPDQRKYADRAIDQIARRNKKYELIRKEKDKPCMDCGKKYPYYVMDFDHVRGVKEANVSALAAQNASNDRIMAEIAKCDVVCANCHRIRTFTREEVAVEEASS